MTMTTRDRRAWRLILWLSAGAVLISAYYGYRTAELPTHGVVTGIASSLFIATPILLFEIWGHRLAIVRRLRRLPLVAYFGIRVAFYVVVIIVGLVAARLLVFGPFEFREIFVEGSFTFSVIMAVLANVVMEIGSLIGFRTLGNLITGRYARPRREQRVFLLIDMKNSTGVAEQLGPIKFHELLNDFFRDVADAAFETGAEIHKYVGDEAILTWPANRTPLDSDVLSCAFVTRDFVAADHGHYRRTYGLDPEFRAALHCGEIVAGQIGDVRREIAYVGDTLNVAARLLDAAKTMGHDILVSTDLLRQAALPANLKALPLPTLTVRGREAPLEIAALQRAGAGA
jgi:adenylate cyclase